MTRFLVAATLVFSMACTKPNPDFCTASSDCKDPAKPFCDVNGDFGDLTNDCIAQPAVDAALSDAPTSLPDGGTCAAGTALSCSGDTLDVCAPNGHSFTQTACPLGCAPGGALRCATFEPSNGLGPALAAAGSAGDVTIPRGSTIDTDTGVVKDSNGAVVAVTTEVVHQSGGPDIRVLLGASFSIDDVTASGSAALAIVATGEIHVIGTIDSGGHASTSGPGAFHGAPSCVGGGADLELCFTGSLAEPCGSGTGGGGGAEAGGRGGGSSGGGAGGTTASTSVLAGGCVGGTLEDDVYVGAPAIAGGGAGGSVQLDSLVSIVFDDAGRIDAGGGGGSSSLGGGGGGTIVLEAPLLCISGSTTGLVANGGGGGGCGEMGPDGGFSLAPKDVASCPPESPGRGGTGTVSAESGQRCGSGGCPTGAGATYGGGGGGVGRLVIVTRNASYDVVGSPVISAKTVARALTPL